MEPVRRREIMRGLLLLVVKDRRGQDLIEYALLAAPCSGRRRVSSTAVMPSVSTIFSSYQLLALS